MSDGDGGAFGPPAVTGGATRRTLGCGCVLEDLFPGRCPRRRELEAQLAQAMRERDWGEARLIAHRIRVHEEGER